MNPFQPYRFFHGMRIPHLGLLMKCAAEKRYEAGEYLFNEGDPVRGFVLIKCGAVALSAHDVDGTRVISTARSGDVLGWSCLVPGAVWDSSGEALAPTTATILDAGRLQAAASENPDFGRELMRRTAQWNVEGRENGQEPLEVEVAPLRGAPFQSRAQTAAARSSELPDDALNLSPADAKELSVLNGQWVRLTGKYGAVILPVRIQPGMKEGCPASDGIGKLPRLAKRQSLFNGSESRP